MGNFFGSPDGHDSSYLFDNNHDVEGVMAQFVSIDNIHDAEGDVAQWRNPLTL